MRLRWRTGERNWSASAHAAQFVRGGRGRGRGRWAGGVLRWPVAKSTMRFCPQKRHSAMTTRAGLRVSFGPDRLVRGDSQHPFQHERQPAGHARSQLSPGLILPPADGPAGCPRHECLSALALPVRWNHVDRWDFGPARRSGSGRSRIASNHAIPAVRSGGRCLGFAHFRKIPRV
jgi:hypothetical protein